MNETHQPAFKGVWIPAEIWERTDLSLFQTILWATISSLSRHDRPCTASNEWLAKRMRSTPGNVANEISKLKALGLIQQVSYDGRVRSLVTEVRLQQKLKCPSANTEVTPQQTLNPEPPTYIQESTSENKDENTAKPTCVRLQRGQHTKPDPQVDANMAELKAWAVEFFHRPEGGIVWPEESEMFAVARYPDFKAEFALIKAYSRRCPRDRFPHYFRKALSGWYDLLDAARIAPEALKPQSKEEADRVAFVTQAANDLLNSLR